MLPTRAHVYSDELSFKIRWFWVWNLCFILKNRKIIDFRKSLSHKTELETVSEFAWRINSLDQSTNWFSFIKTCLLFLHTSCYRQTNTITSIYSVMSNSSATNLILSACYRIAENRKKATLLLLTWMSQKTQRICVMCAFWKERLFLESSCLCDSFEWLLNSFSSSFNSSKNDGEIISIHRTGSLFVISQPSLFTGRWRIMCFIWTGSW